MGYFDFDFSRCLDSKRSTSDYIFTLAKGALISWKSVKQILIVSFTMEVEFIACFGIKSWDMAIELFLSAACKNHLLLEGKLDFLF